MPRPLCSLSLLLTASFSLAACDRGAAETKPDAKQDPAASTQPSDAKAPTAKPEAAPADASGSNAAAPADPKPGSGKDKPAANTYKPPTREQAAESKRSLQAHLDAGRKAVKAKDYSTGIAELEKALAINPLHAKTLGEAGWAYFNAGKLDEAEDRLERGLKYADNDGTRGAILYNLGRVAEAKNDKTAAIERYTRSLAVRPNDTVRDRLTGLGGTPPAADAAVVTTPTHSECGFERKGAPPRNLCLAQLEALGQDPNDPSVDEIYKCEYGRTSLLAEGEDSPPGGAVSAGGEATVYDLKVDAKVKATIYSYLDYDMADESFVLAIVIDDVLYTAPLAWVSHPGVGYADENVEDLKIRAEQLVPGGKPEIVIEWGINGHDMDPGVEMEDLWTSKHVAVVSLDGGQPQWLAALTTERELSSGPMEGWDGEPAPAGETETSREAVTVSWDGGKLVVEANGEASAPVGSFEIAAYPQRCPAELTGY